MDRDKWLTAYRTNKTATWLKIVLTNGDHHFLHDHKEWLNIKHKCDKNSLFISEMQLQFRSHCVTIDLSPEDEAVYFVPSVMGVIGGDTKQYFTVGLLRKGLMHKQMWKTPELIMEKETVDTLEHCFEEAIIYNGKETKENRQK